MQIQWKPLAIGIIKATCSPEIAGALESLVLPGAEAAVRAILNKPHATPEDVAQAFAQALGVWDRIAQTAKAELDATPGAR